MQRLLTLAATVLVPAAAQAAFVDDFSTDANIDPRDDNGTETIDVTTTGSTVELTFNSDFGPGATNGRFTPIDYFPGARDSLSLSPEPSATRFDLVNAGILTMTNVQLINPDGENDVLWALRAFYFGPDDSDGTPDTDTDDDFLGNLVLQGNSPTTGNLSFDVLDQAQTEGGVYANATSYALVIALVKPGNATGEVGDGLVLDEFTFTAIPEPGSVAALGLLGLIGLRRRH